MGPCLYLLPLGYLQSVEGATLIILRRKLTTSVLLILNLGLTTGSASTITSSALLSASPISLVHSIDAALVRGTIELIERLEDSVLTSEHPAVDEPWERLCQLVVHMGPGWDGEDIV